MGRKARLIGTNLRNWTGARRLTYDRQTTKLGLTSSVRLCGVKRCPAQ